MGSVGLRLEPLGTRETSVTGPPPPLADRRRPRVRALSGKALEPAFRGLTGTFNLGGPWDEAWDRWTFVGVAREEGDGSGLGTALRGEPEGSRRKRPLRVERVQNLCRENVGLERVCLLHSPRPPGRYWRPPLAFLRGAFQPPVRPRYKALASGGSEPGGRRLSTVTVSEAVMDAERQR